MFDAYTIKKFLPRLVIAVILANISFPLIQVVVAFVNLLGRNIEGMMLGAQSFGSVAADASSGEASGLIGVATATALVAAIPALAVGGIFALVPAALSILLAFLIVFAVVSIRRILILVLIIVAPAAIALWAIPGMEKWAQRWLKLLLQLLLVYPTIIALIATGAFVASIIPKGGDDSGDLGQSVLILTSLLAPYFLIPTVLKLASGTLANITGRINDRSRGLIDRSKQYRAKKFGENWEKTKSEKRFAGGNETNLRGALNRIMQRGSFAAKGGFNPRKRRAKIDSAIEGRSILDAEKMLKEGEDYFWRGDDDLNRAASESWDEDSLRASLRAQDDRREARGETRKWGNEGSREFESAVSRVEAVRRQMGSDAFRRMTTLQGLAGGTAYDTAGEAWEAVARAGLNDDAATQKLVNDGKSALMNAGRSDQGGAGFGTTYAAVQMMQDDLRQFGTVRQATRDEANRMIHENIWENQGGNVLVHSSMKGQAVREMAPVVAGSVDHHMREAARLEQIAATTGNQADIDAAEVANQRAVQEFASLEATHEGLNASSPEKARIWADGVMANTVEMKNLPAGLRDKIQKHFGDNAVPIRMTYNQISEALQGDQHYKEMRKTYQAEYQNSAGTPPPGAAVGGLPGAPGARP